MTKLMPTGAVCGVSRAVGSLLGQVAAHFGFAPLAIVAGASLMCRLAAADPELDRAASCPDYAALLAAACHWQSDDCPAPCAPLADWCGAWQQTLVKLAAPA